MSTSNERHQQRELLIREVLDNAALGNLAPFIDAIIEGKLDVDQIDSRGYTAIHLAVWKSEKLNMLRLLEKAACPVDLPSSALQTPLMLASVKGDLQIMKILLDRGADIECRDSLGLTPLMCAVQHGKISAFYALIHRGAQIDTVDKNQCSVVHWAAYKNQVPMLRLLNSMKLDMNIADSSKMTALHRAAMSNATDSINYLLSCGLSTEALDEKNRTPLKYALENQSGGAYKILSAYTSSPFPIYSYFSYILILYWIAVVYIYYSNILMATAHCLLPSLLFNVSLLWLIPLYLIIKCSKCITLQESIENPISEEIIEKFNREDFENIVKDDEICVNCQIKRPNRSKHCKFLGKCVVDYDHYCRFLCKTIGKGNRKAFVLGLLVLYVAVAMFLYLSWTELDRNIPSFEHISSYTVRLFLELCKRSGLYKMTIIVSMIVAWYTWWYLLLEILSISVALTVDEMLNRHRHNYLFTVFMADDDSLTIKYHNPFTRGLIKNWVDFLAN